MDAHSPQWITLKEEADNKLSVVLPDSRAFTPRLKYYGFKVALVGEASTCTA